MSKIKLVAMDLDNTLLDSQKQISKHTKEILEQAIQQGVYIVPATGRIFKAIPEVLRNIKGVRYALCSNGATVYDQKEDKILYTNHLTKDTTFELFDILEKYHCTHDIYQNGQGYMESRYMECLSEEYKVSGHLLNLVHETRLPVDDLRKHIKEQPLGIEKINAFFDDMEEREQARAELIKKNIASVSSSLPNNIEINQFGCDKGDGLCHLAKYLGIAMDEVMACGDAGNDTMMIKAAGMGVVMENGQPDVKQVADFITKTNDEDGVAYAIEKFVLNL